MPTPPVQTGKKFFVDIEGTEHPWDKDTITTEEIIQLGDWDPSLGAIEIDKDNNERPLQLGEVIELKPGHGFKIMIVNRRACSNDEFNQFPPRMKVRRQNFN